MCIRDRVCSVWIIGDCRDEKGDYPAQDVYKRQGALSSSGALASSGVGSASVGSVTVNGDDYDAKRIPVASAIAPSAHQNGDCPFISPSTKAIQLPFAGGSGTTGVTLNTICVAKWLGQHEVVERMACNADAAYRKANPNCGE